jgi:REP element-mobilizing transposase RayT
MRDWQLYAVNARTNHVHVVISAPDRPEFVMTAVKANATRLMRERRLVDTGVRMWTRHGSTRYLWNEASLERAIGYVMEGQDLKGQEE